uniref:HAT C-terminal dimerisation domain-containing protein n=1 Tax=Caenorhabditis japonica TaxID=281687 RepID=A0A8R1IAT7_CAEJA
MLEKCSQYSGYISQSGSSISQVIPTILLIKHEMKRQIDGLPPEETVKSIFSEIFMPLTSGEQRQQYDLASLLDPRFAYRSALYTEEEWDDIEKTLLVEFLKKYQVINAPVEDENQYEATVSVYRSTGIVEELESYRNYCLKKRPKEKDNPWQWWTCRQDHMRHLAIMAREIGVCPAVSIDADYFFGSGGKFSHFAKHYTPDQLNKVLILAGYQQKFRGSGASFELAEESNTFDETDLEEGRNNYTVYELAMNKRHKKENYLRMSVEGKKTEEIPAARILSGETLPTPVDNLQPVTEQKPDLYLESTEIKQEKDNMPSTSEYEPNYVDYEISEIDPEEIELLKTEPVELELNPEEQAWLQEEDEVYYPPLSSAPGEEDDEVSEYNMEDDLDD